MLASTVKFSKYNRHPTPTTTTVAISAGPTTRKTSPHTPPSNRPDPVRPGPARAGACRPILQDPTTCQGTHPKPPAAFHSLPPSGDQRVVLTSSSSTRRQNRCSTLEHPLPHTRGQTGLWHH